jgi:hypothetical protein
VEEAARALSKDIDGVADSYPVGKRPQIFKMEFLDTRYMWIWLKSMKGNNLKWEGRRLWHTVEKGVGERLLIKKVCFLMGKLQKALGLDMGQLKEMFPDPDYDRGIVFVKDVLTTVGVRRIFQIPRNGTSFEYVAEGWSKAGTDETLEGCNPIDWVAEVNKMEL